MKIYVIIVTYNGSKWIERCFGSLVTSIIPMSILVIDNGSTDGTLEIIKNKFPNIELIETGQNLGFGKANNIGLRKVIEQKADYAFLLNQDAWVEKDTIEALIQIHINNNGFGVLAPLQLNGEGTQIDKLFLEYSITPARDLVSDLFLKKHIKEVYCTTFINASSWLLPRSTLEIIGGFDPLYPHYGEDNDYINRLKYKGLLIGLCPNHKVYHDRENRVNTDNLKVLINKAYITQLVELKNNSNDLSKKRYFYKKNLLNLLNILFSKNKTYYRIQFKATCKIIKNYHLIIKHRFSELESKSNYINLL